MQIEFSPAVINAFSSFVVTLDQHPVGAAALVGVILAGGASVALASRRAPLFARQTLFRAEIPPQEILLAIRENHVGRITF